MVPPFAGTSMKEEDEREVKKRLEDDENGDVRKKGVCIYVIVRRGRGRDLRKENSRLIIIHWTTVMR